MKKKEKSCVSQGSGQKEGVRAVFYTSRGKVVIPTASLTEEDLDDVDINLRIGWLKERINAGDAGAYHALHRLAVSYVVALNSIQDLTIIKPVSNVSPDWPVMAGPSADSRTRLAELFRRIGLGRNARGLNSARLKRFKTPEQEWIENLISLIRDIAAEAHFLPAGEKEYEVHHKCKTIRIPAELIVECEKLSTKADESLQEMVNRWWPVVKRLFVLLTDDKFQEIPEFRRSLCRSSTRKGAEPGSPAAVSLMRCDIRKKLREALVTRSGARQNKRG